MENFDKLKIASSSLGERLRTGGAQMSRIVSSKMKEILQAPTPESKIIDEATLETMEEPNWGLNLRICAMINSEQFNGTEIVKAIKKKLMGKSTVSQRLSLDLLEACTSNCEKVFSEVASEKVLDDMMKMIDDPKTDHENRLKAMQLIRAWGESEELLYLPAFQQTYMNLKARPVHQGMQDANMPATQYPLDSYLDQGPLSPTESSELHNRENASLFSYIQSVDEKREFLVETRNSLDVLSSILNADGEPKSIKNELTISLLDKCTYSLPAVQRIIEITADDEGMLFEALSLHDDLQQVISRCQDIEAASDSGETASKHSGAGVLPADPDVKETASDSAETVSKHSGAGVLPADPDVKEAASDSGETMPKHSGAGVLPADPDVKGHSLQVQSQNTTENSDFTRSPSHECDSKEPSCTLQIESHSSDETPKAAPLQKVGV